MAVLLAGALLAIPVAAQTLGMVAVNPRGANVATNNNGNNTGALTAESDKVNALAGPGVVVFNADTDTVIGSVPITGSGFGDCVITGDQSRGFVTNFAFTVPVINLTTTPPTPASPPNPIPISNSGEDLSLSPDGKFVVACDGSLVQPVSVINIATQTQVSTLSTGSDCNSVDVDSNGSVLVTSSNSSNVRRLTIDGTGTLTNTGEVVAAGGEPNNVVAAPGAASGVVITRGAATVRSFTVPGLTPVNTRSLSGFGISGVFSPAGDRLFVRTNAATVDVFTYNAATGAIGASPLFTIPILSTPTFFGVDQMAMHPNGTKLYVSQPTAVNVYNPSNGTLITTITNPDIAGATGVCFKAGPAIPSCGLHTVHGHISTVPPGHFPAAHVHHGQHGHTVTMCSPPHHGPFHMTPETEETGLLSLSGTANPLDFAAAVNEDGNTGPAKRGTVIELFGSAGGLFIGDQHDQPADAFTPPASGSPLYQTTTLPQVRIGGAVAKVLFSGLAPGLTGVWQINVVVPEEVGASTLPIAINYEGDELKSIDVKIE